MGCDRCVKRLFETSRWYQRAKCPFCRHTIHEEAIFEGMSWHKSINNFLRMYMRHWFEYGVFIIFCTNYVPNMLWISHCFSLIIFAWYLYQHRHQMVCLFDLLTDLTSIGFREMIFEIMDSVFENLMQTFWQQIPGHTRRIQCINCSFGMIMCAIICYWIGYFRICASVALIAIGMIGFVLQKLLRTDELSNDMNDLMMYFQEATVQRQQERQLISDQDLDANYIV